MNPSTLEVLPQVIYVSLTYKITSTTFILSDIYSFHSIVSRCSLWGNLIFFSPTRSSLWLLVVDFNNVILDGE